MAEPRRVPILLCVDCEPDARTTTPGVHEPWRGFEGVFPVLDRWRDRLAAATGRRVRYNWFWRTDPQMADTYGEPGWALRTYAAHIRAAQRHGDEIGVHPHAFRWDGEWIVDHGNQPWVERCVRVTFETFERFFDRPCRSLRFGDGWTNDATLDLLETLGVRYDLTIEPGMQANSGLHPHERATGSIPDRRLVPTWPYRRARHDFRRAEPTAASRLWMIPISTGHPPGHADDGNPLQFNLCLPPPLFRDVLERLLQRSPHPYLAICCRSDAGTSAAWLRDLEANLHELTKPPRAATFAFTTPADALSLLDCDDHVAGTHASNGAVRPRT